MTKIKVPDGMLEAALSSGVFEGSDDARVALEATLQWQINHWENSPNADRMPDPWYTESRNKWQKFASQWKRHEGISFVDLMLFFGNRLNERFLDPEPDFPPELIPLCLDEAAPDESRPTRRFFNEELLKAYELGKKAGRDE